MREQFLRLMGYVKPYSSIVALAILLGIVVSACTGAVAYAIKPLLDEVLTNRDADMLAVLPWAVLGIFLLKTSATYIQSYTLRALGHRVLADIRRDLFRSMLHQPVTRFTNTASGEFVSRMVNDVQVLQVAVSMVVRDLIQNSVTAVVLAGVVIYMDASLALMAFGVLPLAFYPLIMLSRRMRKRSRKGQEAVSVLTQVLTETIGAVREVKTFGGETREIKRFERANREYRKQLIKAVRVADASSPMMEMIGALGVVAIIWYGGSQVIAGSLSAGGFMSFVAACLMLYGPLRSLATANSAIQVALAAAVRVFAMMDEPTEEGYADRNKPELAGIRQRIAFDRVSHAYEAEGEAAVAEISFTAEVGDVVALVGPSGAGKTTLVNLIPRFIDPTDGAIRIDGTDIRDYTLASLRRQIAIVGQDPVLFDDTVAANIAYGAGEREVTREQVVEAAKRAYAHEFISDMPDGYDTEIGERGVLVSGGQRQRLAIARAILKDAPVLILDEATSALDSESERYVQAALSELMAERTTFVIAHRLATVRHASRILVMDGGRIVEEGTHDELLTRPGLYRKLHDLQFQTAAQGA